MLPLLFLLGVIYCSTIFDSEQGVYKDYSIDINEMKDIYNTTWKAQIINEEVPTLIKSIPTYIDADSELDLMMLDSDFKLYWIPDIRGTSKMGAKKIISSFQILDFVISTPIYFDGYRRDFYAIGLNTVEF